MRILAHRGYWKGLQDQNSREALTKAFAAGFGAETDIRDLDGELVVSHDMPRKGALPLSLLLQDYAQAGQPGTLALNIKSDGLADVVKALLNQYAIQHYFCFDMSVPDTLSYITAGLRAAARISEYEPEGLLAECLPVLWVDGFQGPCITAGMVRRWLQNGKQVCLVSPELHGQNESSLWTLLMRLPLEWRAHNNLMLCTDYPNQATEVLL